MSRTGLAKRLRKENGVDADLAAIQDLVFASMVSGYVGGDLMSDWAILNTRHSWEQRFVAAFKWLGAALGRAYRGRRDGSTFGNLILSIRDECLSQISFTLDERSKWEDAYLLPEEMFPHLFLLLGELAATFAPTSTGELIQLLRIRFTDQLGIYTEGFRRGLSELADQLGVANSAHAHELRLVQLEHIRSCTMNREERVGALLDCSFSASRYGSLDLARRAFEDAVLCSLGPAWYKEAQFALMLDVLDAANNSGLTRKHWRVVLQLLELASGDVTFQRFVRHEKARLIGHLAACGMLAESAALFRHYLLPDSETQKARITSWRGDNVSPLRTGRFGVLEIEEQAGALAVLEAMSSASALRRWAIIELFLPGDDRHYDRFSKIVCSLLSSPYSSVIGERLARLIAADFSPDKRAGVIAALRKFDESNLLVSWLGVVDPNVLPLKCASAAWEAGVRYHGLFGSLVAG